MKKENKINKNSLAIYQSKSGAIELSKDYKKDTIWATQKDLSFIYEKDQSVISRHIRNIFKDSEVNKKSNMQKMHIPNSDKPVDFYSLDVILAVGYRTNSSRAIEFRKWATKVLKQHITKGFTINKNRIKQNYDDFLKTIEDIKVLSQDSKKIKTSDILELIKSFSYTWFSLDKYDKNSFPKIGTKKKINVTAKEIYGDLQKLKEELIEKGEASKMFAQEKQSGSLEGIVGNVFQAVFGADVYKTIEEKAAYLLYFVIKNHPFNDGNKRSGAFVFIWFLNRVGFDFKNKINPETLATLTILVAESNPKDKDKVIGIILLLLNCH
ncbi:virulence protein RhuM/Fic/DOC family protein [Patescibacteria group bacterium]|nr:virulence protein RhuM/Fic/DOC family protein [Patescibacteria group bacterium]